MVPRPVKEMFNVCNYVKLLEPGPFNLIKRFLILDQKNIL